MIGLPKENNCNRRKMTIDKVAQEKVTEEGNKGGDIV